MLSEDRRAVTCTKPIKMISLKQDREEDHQRDGLPKYEKHGSTSPDTRKTSPQQGKVERRGTIGERKGSTKGLSR